MQIERCNCCHVLEHFTLLMLKVRSSLDIFEKFLNLNCVSLTNLYRPELHIYLLRKCPRTKISFLRFLWRKVYCVSQESFKL